MSESIDTKISQLLEAVDKSRVYLSNPAKELFSEGKITFDQYKDMIKQIQTENNKIFSKVIHVITEFELKKIVSDKELEEMNTEHEHWLQEKQKEISAFNSCETSKKILPNTPCVDIDSAFTNKIITNRHGPHNFI